MENIELIDQLRKLGQNDIADQLQDRLFPTRIINMTGHEIRLFNDEGTLLKTFAPEGTIRAKIVRGETEIICGVPVTERYNEINEEDLPPKIPNTFYIVSGVTANASPADRDDLLVVDYPVKDATGKVIGCRGLAFA